MIVGTKKISLKKLALQLSLVALVSPAIACGPFFDDAVFSFKSHPDAPLKLYAQGNLGVLSPTYARSYLLVAYRNLSQKPLTATEVSQAVKLAQFRLGGPTDPNLPLDDSGTQLDNWLKARKKVAGTKDLNLTSYDTYRNIEGDDYITYLNCNADAFATAVKTLNGLIAKNGTNVAPVKEWLTAQDQVFAHCPSPGFDYKAKKANPEPPYPAMLPATASKSARADRAYQIAAAKFYSGDFEVARNLFNEIAKDSESQWHKIAAYMVARTYIREGTLAKDKTVAAKNLQKALETLDGLNARPEFADLKESIDGLRRFVLIRTNSHETYKRLIAALEHPGSDKDFGTNLGDYTYLMDSFFGESADDSSDKHEIKDANQLKLVRDDDMSDWIWTFSNGKETESLSHARAMYQSKKTLPWLLALASKVEYTDSQSEEIKKELAAVPESSSGYTTARYHLARLTLDAGHKDEARSMADNMLAKANLPPSAQNAFKQLKVHTAKNVSDLVKLSFIPPAGIVGGDSANELPENFFDIEKTQKFASEKPLLLPVSADFINSKLGSAAIVEAAQVTANNKADFAQAAFVRSVILSDFASANKALTLLRTAMPAAARTLTGFETASPEDKTFMAAYFILKNPGARPNVRAALPRDTEYGQIDDYQDNWWGNEAASSDQPPLKLAFGEPDSKSGVAKIKALGGAPDYLGRIVIDYAAKHPADKRVPEALHLVVKATHLGATDKNTSKISAEAFKVLHTRYKTNPWTVKTPYHY